MKGIVVFDEKHQKYVKQYIKPRKSDIDDKEILSAIRQDQVAAFARYKELVKARKEREKLRPREPEVYHHDLCKR